MLNAEEKQNVQILAISQDTPAESMTMEAEIAHMPGNLDFPLLTDTGHRVIDAYGIANPAEFKAGIPYPAVYLLSKEGMVLHRFLDAETLSRATNEQIREQLKMLGAVR